MLTVLVPEKDVKAADVVDVAQKQWTHVAKIATEKLGEVFRCYIDIVGVCCEIKKIEQKCDESILESY